jgi:hypothetical protein
MLASFWSLRQIICQPGALEDVNRDGNHWAREAPGWQEATDANVKQAVTCCRTDVLHLFIACHDIRVCAMMCQMLECQW